MSQVLEPSSAPVVAATPSALRDIWRFVVPFIESNIVAVIAHYGFHVSATTAAGIMVTLGTVLGVALRGLEKRWPWVGALLGFVGAPVFPATAKAQTESYVNTLQAQVAQLTAKLNESITPSAPTAGDPPA